MSNGAAADPIFGTTVVAGGGTGATTLTAHGVLFGEGTSAVVASATGTSGIPLIGQGGAADPVFGTAVVAGGGTGATTFTTHGILVGEGTGAVVAVGPSAADQIALWQASTSDPIATGLVSCSTGTSALTYNTGTHAFGCNTISAGTGVALTTAAVASTATITIAATNGLTSIINTGTPATTITLPTGSQTNGFRLCVKDGTENFGTNPATVKATAGTIDGTSGSTGIANFFNTAKQENCFISDGTNWVVE